MTFPAKMQRGKKSTCTKICAFGNCKSDGRTLPPDSDVTFIPFPKPCNDFRDEEIDLLLKNKTSAKRKHEPGKCEKCSRALRWISLCRRQDNRLCSLIDISRNMFVCSKHFVGNAPKETNEDPMPANIMPAQMAMLRRIGKRKPPIDRSLAIATAAPKRRKRMHTAENLDNASPGEDEMRSSLVARPTSAPCSGLPSVVPTASTPIRTKVKESKSTILPTSFNMMKESAKQINTNTPEITTNESVAAPLPMIGVIVPPPTIIQSFPLFVISPQLQPSDIKAFAQERMMSGWACMINEQYACFIRYNVETFASVLEVRLFYCEAQLRCKTFVFGETLPDGSDLATEQQKIVNFLHLQKFMCRLEKMSICKGITKIELLQKFHKMQTATAGKFCNRTNAIRSIKCKLFCCGTKCLECLKYAHSLGTLAARKSKSKNGKIHKNCNNRFLSRECLVAKVILAEKRQKSTMKMLKRLRRKCQKMCSGSGPQHSINLQCDTICDASL